MQVDIPVCGAAWPGQGLQPAPAPVSHQCRVLPQGDPYLQVTAPFAISAVYKEKGKKWERTGNEKNIKKRNLCVVLLLPICNYMLTKPAR